MKKFISFSVIVLFVSNVFAQVEVGTNNKVSIGPYAPVSTYDLNTGSAQFNSNVKIAGKVGIGLNPSTTNSLELASGLRVASGKFLFEGPHTMIS